MKKAEAEDLVEIKRLCSILPTHDNVVKLKAKVDKSVAEFSKENFEFNKQFQNQNEIIRRYDEVLN